MDQPRTQPKVGDRVRVHYDFNCDFCLARDPNWLCDGHEGTVVSIIPITFTNHLYEVAFDAGTVLRNVPVPYFGGTVDLPEPNFAATELTVLRSGGDA